MKNIARFGFHGTLWFYSGISIVALLYGFYFMPDYSRYPVPSTPYTANTLTIHSIISLNIFSASVWQGLRKRQQRNREVKLPLFNKCQYSYHMLKASQPPSYQTWFDWCQHGKFITKMYIITIVLKNIMIMTTVMSREKSNQQWQRASCGDKAVLIWWDPFHCVISFWSVITSSEHLAKYQDEGGNDKTHTKGRWTFSLYHNCLSSPATANSLINLSWPFVTNNTLQNGTNMGRRERKYDGQEEKADKWWWRGMNDKQEWGEGRKHVLTHICLIRWQKR